MAAPRQLLAWPQTAKVLDAAYDTGAVQLNDDRIKARPIRGNVRRDAPLQGTAPHPMQLRLRERARGLAGRPTPRPHFDEGDIRPFGRYEVDLSSLRSGLAFENLEACRFQVMRREPLPPMPS